MCRDGNSASQSARYINGQLTTLWENAVECVEDGGEYIDACAEDYEKRTFVRAPAQFYFYGKKAPRTVLFPDSLLFEARFGKPELKFVCNHEAVLYINIKSGRLNLEYSKASATDYELDM